MRSSYYRIGVVAVVVVAAILVGGKLSPERKIAPDADAKAYVDAAIPAICTSWDREQLIARASPDFAAAIQAIPSEFFDKLSSVGPLVKYEGATGHTNAVVYNGNAKTTADFKANAQFANGPATVEISLVRYNDSGWQISAFHIDPASQIGPTGKNP
jgi:hypothetical protein